MIRKFDWEKLPTRRLLIEWLSRNRFLAVEIIKGTFETRQLEKPGSYTAGAAKTLDISTAYGCGAPSTNG